MFEEVVQGISGQVQSSTGLMRVKKVDDIQAKVPLEPLNVRVSAVKHLGNNDKTHCVTTDARVGWTNNSSAAESRVPRKKSTLLALSCSSAYVADEIRANVFKMRNLTTNNELNTLTNLCKTLGTCKTLPYFFQRMYNKTEDTPCDIFPLGSLSQDLSVFSPRSTRFHRCPTVCESCWLPHTAGRKPTLWKRWGFRDATKKFTLKRVQVWVGTSLTLLARQRFTWCYYPQWCTGVSIHWIFCIFELTQAQTTLTQDITKYVVR